MPYPSLPPWPESARDNASTSSIAPPPLASIAPWWHTIGLLVFLAVSGIYGVSIAKYSSPVPYTARFLLSCMSKIVLLGAVIGGVYHRSDFLKRTLLHRACPWSNEFGTGLIVYFIGIVVASSAVATRILLHQPHKSMPPAVLALFPHTTVEVLVWLVVSLTAGIVEEVLFRGYLLRQLTAWTGRTSVAIAALSILFGAIHLYEGLPAVVALTLLSVLYCIVTLYRGNIRAVMIAHALQDFFAGVAGLLLTHTERFRHLM
jgi:uncharacterized protein